MLTYRLVDVEQDQDTIVEFFVDAGNGEEDPDFHATEYLEFAKNKSEALPEGFLLVEVEGETIGELVLRILPYENRTIGYVSLIYLKPAYRGKGYSQAMFAHAEQLFHNKGVSEYHLRVSVINDRAISFYKKQGLTSVGEEYNLRNQLCYRMAKVLDNN